MIKYRRSQERQNTRHILEEDRSDDALKLVAAIKAASAEPELASRIWNENEGMKRINGHSPEYVAEGFGESVEEIFPPDGLTLYVGDPWQKLDRKGVVIIDYEFGPIAEFQDDREKYLRNLDHRLSTETCCRIFL